MNGRPRLPSSRSDAMGLPCHVFLDAPNEVTDPDFGLFRDTLNEHFYPARVEALNPSHRPHEPRITAVHLALTTIGYVRPGTTASVDPGDLSAYHVNVALSGDVVSRCGNQEALASPRVATVFSPDRHTSLPRWGADAAQLSIKLSRSRVEEELASLLGRPVVKPIDFQLAFPVHDGIGRRWTAVLSALLQSVGAPCTPAHQHHTLLLERTLISSLLLSQLHSYTEFLIADPRPAKNGAVDRVVREIDRAPDRGYTVGDLAALAGVSARSLQYAFQDAYQLSPMQYVRQVRLDRAHDDLAAGTGPVAETAAYWGFSNPGRFARAYRDRFGETPVATLDGSRAARSR